MRDCVRFWPYGAFVLSASLIVSFLYVASIDLPNVEKRLKFHKEMLDHTAPIQYRHRVAAPYAGQVLMRAAALPGPQRMRPEQSGSLRAFLIGYAILETASIAVAFWFLYRILLAWFGPTESLVGVMFALLTTALAVLHSTGVAVAASLRRVDPRAGLLE